MKKIREVRTKIDQIDIKILNLIKARFKLINDIAYLKKERGLVVYQKQREKELLKKTKEHDFLNKIYKSILKESKNYQKYLIRRFTKGKKIGKIV